MTSNSLKKLIKASPNANKDIETLKMWSTFVAFPMNANDIIMFRSSQVYQMLTKETLINREELDLLSDTYVEIQNCTKIYAEELVILWADALGIDILSEVTEGYYPKTQEWNRSYVKTKKVYHNICKKCGREFATYKKATKRCPDCEVILSNDCEACKN